LDCSARIKKGGEKSAAKGAAGKRAKQREPRDLKEYESTLQKGEPSRELGRGFVSSEAFRGGEKRGDWGNSRAVLKSYSKVVSTKTDPKRALESKGGRGGWVIIEQLSNKRLVL